ncbi:hypothetical protein T492DRAFT_356450 [Pavlovales sp. CCMP2436]|nr:hypothetical protein T492DRAFT_356450 [Pavlovales sp. CCMP2436]
MGNDSELESESELEGVVLPSVSAAAGDDECDESDDAVDPLICGGEPTGEGDASDAGEEGAEDPVQPDSGLPDAAAAFDPSSAPPGAELDPFRSTAAALTAKPTEQLKVGKATMPKAAFDTIKHHIEHLANRKLFVGGVPPSMDDSSLLKFFSKFGKVQEVKLGVHADTGKSRGFAFVTFAYHKGARFCLEQGHEKEMDGKTVRCEVASMGEQRGPPVRRSVVVPPPAAPAAAVRKQAPPPAATTAAAAVDGRVSAGQDGGAGENKRRREPRGTVSITRREDAEPVDKRRISVREIFPKEFWRV